MFNRSSDCIIRIIVNRSCTQGFFLLELLVALGLFCSFVGSHLYYINRPCKSFRDMVAQIDRFDTLIHAIETALDTSSINNVISDFDLTKKKYTSYVYTMKPVHHTANYTYLFQNTFKFILVQSSWKNESEKKQSIELIRGMIGAT